MTSIFTTHQIPGQECSGRNARIRKRIQLRKLPDQSLSVESQQPEKQLFRRKWRSGISSVTSTSDAVRPGHAPGRSEQPVLPDAVRQWPTHRVEDRLHDTARVLEQSNV